MPYSLAELSDRMEITDTLTAYSTAVDSRRFDDLRNVFTADAHIDYTASGGIAGTLDECISWLGEVLPGFSAYCHFLGNVEIDLDGDAATSRAMCLNPMQVPDHTTFLIGIYYRDTWRRTAGGWRMATRAQDKIFDAKL